LKLLTVDWDYFFLDKLDSGEPDCLLYDWGHKETQLFINSLWEIRASGFLRYNLPLPQTTGEDLAFWDNFQFSRGAILYYAESHSFIVDPTVRRGVTEIWSFDAHQDAGYGRELSLSRVTCEDWLAHYHDLGITNLHVRYPLWQKQALENEPPIPIDQKFVGPGETSNLIFDRIFICRSGAWVPSWLDGKFDNFVRACPVGKKICTEEEGKLSPRNFSLEVAKQMAQPLEFPPLQS